jgi:hypothetical protein
MINIDYNMAFFIYDKLIILPSRYIYLLTPFKQNWYESSRELSRTYQLSAGVITKFSQHLNDNSCEDDKSK